MRMLIRFVAVLALFALGGCETAYYGAWEQFGIYKRDLLVARVEDAAEAQEDAKAEFQDALEQFASVVTVEPSRLKQTYQTLSDAYDDVSAKAEKVTERVDAVQNVSEDLFDEWRDELEQINSVELRRASQRQLKASERKYRALIKAMRRAEMRMHPVLTAFNDHVLFLKHNLNAQAIASLKGELGSIESNVSRLIEEMEASIAQSQAFIQEMQFTTG